MDSLFEAILARDKTDVETKVAELGLVVDGKIGLSEVQSILRPYRHLVSEYKFTIYWVAIWTIISNIIDGDATPHQLNNDAMKFIRVIKIHAEIVGAVKTTLPMPIWEEMIDNL